MHNHISATNEAVKAAPAIGGAATSVALETAQNAHTFFGVPWSTVAAMLTAAYVATQMTFFLYDRYVIWRSKRDSQQPAPPQS